MITDYLVAWNDLETLADDDLRIDDQYHILNQSIVRLLYFKAENNYAR